MIRRIDRAASWTVATLLLMGMLNDVLRFVAARRILRDMVLGQRVKDWVESL